MNHCIPNRELSGGVVYEGVIVTPPMAGSVVHLAYKDSCSPLFCMRTDLFRCNKYRLTNTERIRREQVLNFGDRIRFTCVTGNSQYENIVIDYEKNESSVGKCAYENGKYLLKTICILPPMWARTGMTRHGPFIWTQLFGKIVLDSKLYAYVSARAHSNVPIYCWLQIQVDYDNYTFSSTFYEFHEDGIAQEDKYVVWDTDWNIKSRSLKSHPLFVYESDGDDVDDLVRRDDYAFEIGVRTGLEGIVISSHEVFCPTFRDKRVYIGLWNKEQIFENPLQGYKIRFDAFLSEVTDCYIAYYYELDHDKCVSGSFCQVKYVNDSISNSRNVKLLTECQLYDHTLGGFLMHDYFGLIADRKECLRALPLIEEAAIRSQFHSSPLSLGYGDNSGSLFSPIGPNGALHRYVFVYLVDKGPDSTLARFEVDSLPEYTAKLVAEADNKLAQKNFYGEGFVVREEIGQVYAYKYPALQFFIKDIQNKKKVFTGVWIRFQANYSAGAGIFTIHEFDILCEKSRIDCRPDMDDIENSTYQRPYEFKINVEHHKLVENALYNPIYGFVVDRNHEFKGNRKFKFFSVIVVQDSENSAITLFRLKRMAKRDEVLNDKEPKIGKIVDIYADELGDECTLSAAERRNAHNPRGDIYDFGVLPGNNGPNINGIIDLYGAPASEFRWINAENEPEIGNLVGLLNVEEGVELVENGERQSPMITKTEPTINRIVGANLSADDSIAVARRRWIIEQYVDNRQLSGVEYNSKYLRRERKVEARQRRIERDRLARVAATSGGL